MAELFENNGDLRIITIWFLKCENITDKGAIEVINSLEKYNEGCEDIAVNLVGTSVTSKTYTHLERAIHHMKKLK